MLIDFSRFDGDLPKTDVIIVGSGAAGISMAMELVRLGKSVLIVEAGSLANDAGELGEFFRAGQVRNHPKGEMYRRRMVGGTTAIWGGRCIPYERSDFAPLAAGDGAQWPFDYDEARPYIDRAVEWLDAGVAQFDTATALPGSPPQMIRSDDPALSLGEIERFSLPLNSWKSYGAALVKRDAAHIAINCAAIELVADDASPPVYGLRVRSPGGREALLRGSTIVLATGGIETPRLLLASRGRHAAGVGNEHDLVGRYFMSHVIADAGHLDILDYSGLALDYERTREGTYVRRLMKLAEPERMRLGLMNMIARPAMPNVADPSHRSGILSMAFMVKRFIIPEYRQRLAQNYPGIGRSFPAHVGNVVRAIPTLPFFGFDWTRRRILARRKLPSLFIDGAARYPLQLIGEQAPLARSRITLAEEEDRHSMLRVAIDWRYCPDDVESMRETMRIMARGLEHNPFARVTLTEKDMERMADLVPQGGHHIGTTRMGRSPSESVTDEYGRVWNSRNLYIAGSALFPRSGAANPTLMIVALALRSAPHISKGAGRHAQA